MIATVSDVSRRDLIENWGVLPHRIIMARNCVGKRFSPSLTSRDLPFLRQWGLASKNYLLAVLDDRPHKNLATLLRAFTGLDMPPIVIVGTKKNSGRDRDLPAPFFRISSLDDDHLAILYRHARALLHPALMEGFGLPPLEAMASGTPVIVSDIPIMHEIVGTCGRFVQPTDVAGWRSAVLDPPSSEGVTEQAARFRGEETYSGLWTEITKRMGARSSTMNAER